MSSTNLSREEKLKILKQRIENSKKDPVAFVDNFFYTFDPKRVPYHFRFKLFPFQKDLILDIKSAIEKGEDIFIDKCREMGATYCVLAVYLWFWRYEPGSNFLLGSRKQDYVDNTKGNSGDLSNKEESLFGKIEYMLTRLPSFMLPGGFDFKKHLTFMSLINPENGNVVSGESSNPNFSRGGRQKSILLDEFAFWDNDSSAWGSTADTTNCRIVLTTPGIRPSKAKRLRFGKDGEKIRVIELDYNLDPRKDKIWLTDQRARRSKEDFAREIMRNWETSVKGKVYEEIQYAQVGNFPYDPNFPLFVAWDFGLDGVAIQFWQKNLRNGKLRLVESYHNDNKPIQFYFPFFPGNMIDSKFTYSEDELKLIALTSLWKRAIHFGDPDVSKRSLLTGTSTRQALESVHIYVQTRPEANDFASRREKTKVMLQVGVEVNRTLQNEYWLECISDARYPQRNENSNSTTPINLPIHDYTSHHRTATEYLAVNYESSNQAGGDPEWERISKEFENNDFKTNKYGLY